MPAVKQTVTLESFDHQEALKMLVLSDELWLYICSSSYFVIIYVYYIKLRVHGLKTYGINGKEALTGDWEELNKKTFVCNVFYNFKVYFCMQI